MQFTSKTDPMFDVLAVAVRNAGFNLIELKISRTKPQVQVQIMIHCAGVVSINDCARVHRILIPQLELAFPGQDFSLEVSSPGIHRSIKDASEFRYYCGQGVRCYCSDTAEWIRGIIEGASETTLILKGIPYTIDYTDIKKAFLDPTVT
ncbi:MAG: ribosome assembly cofactor RimP [Treponema sp.]|jgi:ribosome maturation factor RimP|nr:ribosome assembly cofactor RimP [Treponema sp.]